MAIILDGKKTANQFRETLARQVADFAAETAVIPCLAAVLVGDDPASQVYVRNKQSACSQAGIASRLLRLPAGVLQTELLDEIERLNHDPAVHGILVQLPLPGHLNTQQILDAVDPSKDVDCFHPDNVGRLVQERPRFLPCTPHGVLQLLQAYQLKTAGKHVVVVGRSEIVGKPMAALLMQKNGPLGADYANAMVTVCHSRSGDTSNILRQADILIAAIGQPQCIRGEQLRPGAVVIDVGINRIATGLVGDVDFESCAEVASAITPVPGGIGPLTVAMLLDNTLRAARLRTKH
ncbi:MAG: bifunctional 5,10-methylenetetrahydrofolate dehydrogenase/5,10-methenyltetrahydrofolate cyclohydrolase [Planctomycetaceae bacterium]|nr:bifunctional 5,10-methylenetetrahydrofolate dehydrogenase/5,10-methenyltetrahydrofolate cyclohydrolase [Planctomycetaceae bacterium]